MCGLHRAGSFPAAYSSSRHLRSRPRAPPVTSSLGQLLRQRAGAAPGMGSVLLKWPAGQVKHRLPPKPDCGAGRRQFAKGAGQQGIGIGNRQSVGGQPRLPTKAARLQRTCHCHSHCHCACSVTCSPLSVSGLAAQPGNALTAVSPPSAPARALSTGPGPLPSTRPTCR